MVNLIYEKYFFLTLSLVLIVSTFFGLTNTSKNNFDLLPAPTIDFSFTNNSSCAGTYYSDTDIWLGASIRHLNRPNIAFFEDNNLPLDIFYSLHANYRFSYFIDNKMLLSANFMQQGEFNRFDLGASAKLENLFLGIMTLTNPAKNHNNSHLLTSINTFIGLELEKLRFGFSYDFNTSKIGRTDGVYELLITYLSRCLLCRDPANTERRK